MVGTAIYAQSGCFPLYKGNEMVKAFMYLMKHKKFWQILAERDV